MYKCKVCNVGRWEILKLECIQMTCTKCAFSEDIQITYIFIDLINDTNVVNIFELLIKQPG